MRLDEVVAEAVAGGVDLVQFRNFAQDTMSLSNLPRTTRPFGFSRVALFDRTTSSQRDEDGTQIPDNAKMPASALRDGFAHAFIGRSVHSVERAIRAVGDGADYFVAGTIYPSNSHPGEPGQGVGFLREVCAAVAPLPVIAIGGITPERVGECIAAGAAGVAVLSPIMRADDPQTVARTYREALDTAWKQRNE